MLLRTKPIHKNACGFCSSLSRLLAEAHLPNHILGMRYARETCQYPSPMKLLPISKETSGLSLTKLSGGMIASATAIRKAVKAGQEIKRVRS